ncbi:AAA family ATPase [Vibrio tritonius]|uniref:AAA family ATPase n=1 Tax=Vibrio tritonius TaxID=1435069 RepID=A0ABS7YJX9_9VIBR|nr:AAA family ATPase [Vibrio tritonius]MCA2015989.1 AAA family ATPase [Vibrio tritonius]
MYQEFFGFNELPFSIVPNSRYLFLSHRHREAMTYLQSGLGDGGGFAMLTGEVGTGKTTVAKAMLANLPDTTRCGFILNPTFSERELLEAICDEFEVSYPEQATLKQLSQSLGEYLLEQEAQGCQVLLIIDEAQHLAPDVLEQLRLLTNLETEQRKLLKVLLVGQPELQEKLQMPQLRQLAQRITARYHILPLDKHEVRQYIQFRLECAGGDAQLFPDSGIKWLATQTHGIPRLINLVCDAALKAAYQAGQKTLTVECVKQATAQIMSFQSTVYQASTNKSTVPGLVSLAVGIGLSVLLTLVWPLFSANLVDSWYPLPPKAQPIEQVQIPQTIMSALEKASEREPAVTALFGLWGYQASVVDTMCQDDAPSQLECETREGDWDDIAELKMPVILQLEVNGAARYVVLSHWRGDWVDVLIDGQQFQIEKQWLESYWHGQYALVWKRMFHRTLKLGMQGDDVAELDNKLAMLLKMPLRSDNQFDQELQHRVELFQRWQHMNVDGVAGNRTLQKIEEMSQEDAPKLEELTHVDA